MPEVTIGKEKFEVPPLGGVAGLEAAQMIIPRLVDAQAALENLAGLAINSKTGEDGKPQLSAEDIRVALDSAGDLSKAMLPLLKPDDFVRLTHLLTGVSEETLRTATLTDLLNAAAVGLVNADLRGIMQATGMIYGQIVSGGATPVAEAPEGEEG